jgi:hypothetical protein
MSSYLTPDNSNIFSPVDGRELFRSIHPDRESLPHAEHRLMLAVLEDAIGLWQKHLNAKIPKQRKLWFDTCAWIDSDDLEWPFSFPNICGSLGLDPDYIRQGLREQERQYHRGEVKVRERRPQIKARTD